MNFVWPIQPTPKTTPGQQFGVTRSRGEVHTGLDMGKSGNSVLACCSGKVVVAKNSHDIRGNIIHIDHGSGYESRYFHLDSYCIRKGDNVSANQKIGVVGKSGLPHPWPHLHFEALLNGSYQNPLSLLPDTPHVGGNTVSAYLYPPDAPLAPSNSVWPIAISRTYKVPTGMNKCAIGTERASKSRTHAGIDITGHAGDQILAITDGQILSFYWFYSGPVLCLFVDHGSFVCNYGEVDPNSLTEFGLKTPMYKPGRYDRMYYPETPGAKARYDILGTGSRVVAGQPIARVGRISERSAMLHLEMYVSGTKVNKSWMGFHTSPPSGLLNPTVTMQEIATRMLGRKVPTREPSIESVCR